VNGSRNHHHIMGEHLAEHFVRLPGVVLHISHSDIATAFGLVVRAEREKQGI
jgi:hypothetical protein